MGNSVMVDWTEGFHSYVLIDCAKADGSPLPFVSDTPILLGSHWQSWGFNKINPWQGRFAQLISRQDQLAFILLLDPKIDLYFSESLNLVFVPT